jgi:hypothetical protein
MSVASSASRAGYKIFDRYKEHGLSAPMDRSRRPVRTVSESMRTPILSLGATSSSIASRIEGTPGIRLQWNRFMALAS